MVSPGADPHEGDGGAGEEHRHEEEGLPAPDVRQGADQRSRQERQEALNHKTNIHEYCFILVSSEVEFLILQTKGSVKNRQRRVGDLITSRLIRYIQICISVKRKQKEKFLPSTFFYFHSL